MGGLPDICLGELSADKNLICSNDLDFILQTFSLLKWAWSFAFEWISKNSGNAGINLMTHKSVRHA